WFVHAARLRKQQRCGHAFPLQDIRSIRYLLAPSVRPYGLPKQREAICSILLPRLGLCLRQRDYGELIHGLLDETSQLAAAVATETAKSAIGNYPNPPLKSPSRTSPTGLRA